MFVISVHEISHLLGLPHNPSGSSVMFFLDLDDSVPLDAADLAALASRHKMRAGISEKGGLTSARIAKSDCYMQPLDLINRQRLQRGQKCGWMAARWAGLYSG